MSPKYLGMPSAYKSVLPQRAQLGLRPEPKKLTRAHSFHSFKLPRRKDRQHVFSLRLCALARVHKPLQSNTARPLAGTKNMFNHEEHGAAFGRNQYFQRLKYSPKSYEKACGSVAWECERRHNSPFASFRSAAFDTPAVHGRKKRRRP